MLLSNIKRSSVTDKLKIDTTAIIHFVPDFNIDLSHDLDNLSLYLNNCEKIYINPSKIQILGKDILGSQYYSHIKKTTKTKKINFVKTLPNNINDNKFIIYDHSNLIKVIHSIINKANNRQLLVYLFKHLKEIYQNLKTTEKINSKEYEHILFFGLNKHEDGLIKILQQITTISRKDLIETFNVFDVHAFISTFSDKHIVFPLMRYSELGNIEIFRQNLFTKMDQALQLLSTLNDDDDDDDDDDNKKENDTIDLHDNKEKNIYNVADDIAEKTDDIDDIEQQFINYQKDISDKASIDKTKLSKILKKYNIEDLVLISNIKASIEKFIDTNGLKKTKLDKENQEDIELLVLQAINNTIYGTTELSKEVIDNPTILFDRLSETNIFTKDIEYPTTINAQLSQPNDVIDIHKISGPTRHKYEFEENIDSAVHTLFNALEKKSPPIQIKNIKSEIKDDNLDRVIEYTVTLQNIAGGYKEPYDVTIEFPGLINEKYFKLNGKDYIMSAQQFLNPITKEKPTEVRMLTHFSTITTSVVNMKYNISQMKELLSYINNKYKKNIIESKRDNNSKIYFLKFKNKNGDETITIDLLSTIVYSNKTKNEKLVFENGSYKLLSTGGDLKTKINTIDKNEFIFNKLTTEIQQINQNEQFITGKKTIPYLRIYLIGIKMPIIFYFWHQLGLIETLLLFQIKYEFGKEPTDNTYHISLPYGNDDQFLYMYPKTIKQNLVCNGLLTILPKIYSKFNTESDFSDKKSIYPYLIFKFGSKTPLLLAQATSNSIDSVTKQMLDFYEYPDNIVDILTQVIIPMLLNTKESHPADLKNYRVRMSEVLTNSLYNNIIMAYNFYKNKIDYGDQNAKIYIDKKYIINNIMGRHVHAKNSGGALVDYINPYSPVDELVKASVVKKTGKGGIPDKRSFKKELRSIHPSYIGNISAHSTSEYGDVGIINEHTLGVNLTNSLGNYGGKTAATSKYKYDSLSIDEALIPFCSQMDSSRLVIARTHVSQKIPIMKAQPALVETGAEYITAQLASSKFVHRAKNDGVVIEVKKNNYIVVRYVNGSTETFDIGNRYSSTKMNSTIKIGMNNLEKNQTFKKDQMIAWNDIFNGDTLSNGRNCLMAMMNYEGFSHEDGYVISNKMANEFVSEHIIKVSVVIPRNVKILNVLTKINEETKPNEPLIEFQYLENLDTYIDDFDVSDSMDENNDYDEDAEAIFLQNSENKTISRLSPGGNLVDLKIYLNTKKDIDGKLLDMWKQQAKRILEKQKKLTTNNDMHSIDNLDTSVLKIGNHKFDDKSAQIVFYISKPNVLKKGNKISNRYGAKGMITHEIDDVDVPNGEYSGKIDVFLGPTSMLGRKNTSIIKELYIGKILYFLPKIINNKLNSGTTIHEARTLIGDVYELLDTTTGKEQTVKIKENLKNIPDNKLKTQIKNEKLRFNLIIPPFTTVNLDKLKTISQMLDLPLEEHVYLPKLKTWTKTKVPVGIQYMSAMEQTAEDYENTRSKAGYVGRTGQPVKGKKRHGGQSIGALDIDALLTFEVNDVLNELMTIRSDDMKRKRIVESNLRNYGYSDLPEKKEPGKTRELFDLMITGMLLKLN